MRCSHQLPMWEFRVKDEEYENLCSSFVVTPGDVSHRIVHRTRRWTSFLQRRMNVLNCVLPLEFYGLPVVCGLCVRWWYHQPSPPPPLRRMLCACFAFIAFDCIEHQQQQRKQLHKRMAAMISCAILVVYDVEIQTLKRVHAKSNRIHLVAEAHASTEA